MEIKKYDQTNFQATKLFPKLYKWDDMLLDSVLGSKKIRKIIERDAKSGCDTFIKYEKKSDSIPSQTAELTINNGEIRLEEHNNDVFSIIKQILSFDSNTTKKLAEVKDIAGKVESFENLSDMNFSKFENIYY